MSPRFVRFIAIFELVFVMAAAVFSQPTGTPSASPSPPVASPTTSPSAAPSAVPSATPSASPASTQPKQTPSPNGLDLDKVAAPPERRPQGRFFESVEQQVESRREKLNARLPRFGESFFNRSREELTRSDDGLVPPDYVLRPGDQVHTVAYNLQGGESVSDLTVDQYGQAYMPQVGPVTLGGLTLAQAQVALNNQVQARAANFRVKTTMTKIRKIRVFVLGEAKRPGGIVVNPGSTLLDALLASEGPTDNGSFRKVQLRRGGRLIAIYDLYQLFLDGSTNSPRLVEGDRIFIPTTGKQIAISGEVVRPAIFEVLREKNLAQMLKLAGGLKPQADKQQILLERLSGNSLRRLRDVKLFEAKNINIRDGDTVTVKPLLDELANAVYIRGAVKRPGWYSIPEGMRISSLLSKAQGMKDGVYPDRAEIYRRPNPEDKVRIISFDLRKALAENSLSADNPVLQPRDTVVVYEELESEVYAREVNIQGEVAKPGVYDRFENMTLRDLIHQAGGTTPEASDVVEITRKEKNGDLTKNILDLTVAINDPASSTNVALKDLDTVIVRKTLRARRWPATITVSGEVNQPGVYTINPEKDSLADILVQAGGLTRLAYPRGAVFIRKKNEILDRSQEKLAHDVFDVIQDIANRFAQAEENRTNGGLRGASGPAGGYYNAASASLLPIFAKGAAEGGIREIDRILTTTRIPIGLSKLVNHEGRDPGVRDGDVLYVPPEPQVVVVAGAVVVPSPILHQDGLNLDQYIHLAGGVTEDAAQDKIFVIKADGTILRKDSVRGLEKGDVIIVPPQPIIAEADGFETFISLAQILINGLFIGRILR